MDTCSLNPSYFNLLTRGIVYQQFTGLKDKNGKDIYEGDIIKAVAIGSNFSEDVIGNVEFQDFEYIIISNTDKWPAISFAVLTEKEIVGNIFETPELLKWIEKLDLESGTKLRKSS